jgi:hypothetical protein
MHMHQLRIKRRKRRRHFFEKLEGAYDKLPANDIRIIEGNTNAKIGKENILRNHAGMYSLHENTSENGNRLVNFAVSKNIVTCIARQQRDKHLLV